MSDVPWQLRSWRSCRGSPPRSPSSWSVRRRRSATGSRPSRRSQTPTRPRSTLCISCTTPFSCQENFEYVNDFLVPFDEIKTVATYYLDLRYDRLFKHVKKYIFTYKVWDSNSGLLYGFQLPWPLGHARYIYYAGDFITISSADVDALNIPY